MFAIVISILFMETNFTLRPFRLSDVDDLMSYAGDDQVTRSLRWKTLTTRDEALTFIKDVVSPTLGAGRYASMTVRSGL